MVDNWLLEDIVDQSNDNIIPESLCVLLSALVLWDNVRYPLNDKDYWRRKDISNTKWEREIYSIRDNLSYFDDRREEYQKEQERFFRKNIAVNNKNISKAVGVGALRYLSVSNKHGFDYLPCSDRGKFIKQHAELCRDSVNKLDVNRLDVNRLDVNRFDMLSPLDKEIDEFLKDLSKAFGNAFFSVKRPVLVDYIIQNTPQDMSYVDYAIHLKHHGAVVQYRRYLQDVEDALNNYNLMELIRIRQYSKEVVDDVAKMDSSVLTAEFNILPIQALSLSKDINISKKKMQLTFLKELARFSFNGRILK